MNDNDEASGFTLPSGITDFLQTIVIALCICVIVYLFIATPNQIEQKSMEPNFFANDVIVTNKVSQWLGNTDVGKGLGLDYKRGDVIVFQKPGQDDFIKRIIGMPGERISIREGGVYINGKQLQEKYLPPATFTKGSTFVEEGGEGKTVGDGEYFVMGDNRGDSHDSRHTDIGFVKREWMKGKVVLRYLPVEKFGIINTGEYEIE